MYDYKYLNEISQDKKDEVRLVRFFRHKGLYMCHTFGINHKNFNFYLTERDEFLTKGQAKERLRELFPEAKIEFFIVRRDQPKHRF